MAMIRTWVVVVEAGGVGHEMHNTLDAAEFFGPYTERQAERLAERLTHELAAIAEDEGDTEPRYAHAMPLEHVSPNDVMRRYRIEPAKD
jgi:hypothetical protein